MTVDRAGQLLAFTAAAVLLAANLNGHVLMALSPLFSGHLFTETPPLAASALMFGVGFGFRLMERMPRRK